MRNKTSLTNRILSGLLAVMMIAGIFGTWPITIFAEERAKENVVDVWDGSIANGFGGGNGTSDDPYQIYTGAELAYLASSTNGGTTYSGQYFKLMNDINLNGISWTPIGRGSQTEKDDTSSYSVFKGTFNGDGHKILGLSINSNNLMKVGLFASIVSANILSLGVENASVTMTYGSSMSYGSVLCGAAYMSTISGCYVIGVLDVTNTKTSPSHNATAGMIVGFCDSSYVTNCYAAGSVTAKSSVSGTFKAYAGGIAGSTSNTVTIRECYFVGVCSADAVSREAYAAGIAGCKFDGSLTIKNCFAEGSFRAVSGTSPIYVSAMYTNLQSGSGGASVSNCYQNVVDTNGSIINATTTATTENFQSQDWIASTLGWDFESVWTFDYTYEYPYPVLQGFAGFGELPEACEHNYIETENVEPTCLVDGYVRYTCAECGDAYDEKLPALGHTTEEGTCERCGEYIEAPKADAWDGTVDISWYNPADVEFVIVTAEQLAGLAQLVNEGNSFCGQSIYLGCDLDLSNYDWTPIGQLSNSFAGTFDGLGHIIDNLTIHGSYENAGLFGKTTNATVCNVGLKNVDVQIKATAGWLEVGALIGGQSDGTTSGCFVEGNIYAYNSSGQLPVGGVVGLLLSGKVENCYSIVSIVGEGNTIQAGGLIGATGWYGGETIVIENCFAISSVSAIGNGTTYAGGLVSDNYAKSTTVRNCFVRNCSITANGYSGAVYGNCFNGSLYLENCYYASCNVSDNRGAYSTDIENLKSQSWLTSTLGWDFENVWMFDDSNGNEYPILQAVGGGDMHIHNYVETERVDPVCGVEGYVRYTCTECERSYDEILPAPEHQYTESERVEPTCQVEGYIRYTCVVCGDYYDEPIGVLEHQYLESERVEPTCQVEGYVRYTCTMCGDYYDDVLSTIRHNVGEDNYCTMCGEYIEAPKADLWDGTVAGSFGGGSGTEYDPYLIYTGAELAYLAYSTNNGNSYSGKYFLLMSNIDLCGIEWTPIGVGSNYDVFSTAFRGNFDGQFHTILGLNITKTTSRNIGLFGTLYNATVQNLQISEGYLAVEQDGSNASTSAGLLVGSMDGTNTISHVSVSGEVSVRTLYNGICSVAAVVGYIHYNAAITITNVSAVATVSGFCSGYNSYVGGIVGVKNNSTGTVKIFNSIFIGTVSASDSTSHSYAGGILGISCGGETIQNCVFIGEIYTDDTRDAISDYFNKTPNYSNCYYNANFTSTRGTYTDLGNLQSQDWFAYTLGWDFANVWTFADVNGYAYPVLQGFDGIGGNAHVHNHVETERVEPTCGVEGYIRYTCTECERFYDETIPALEHQYIESERVEPTCQYEGYIRYTCTMCGNYYDETLYTLAHEYTESERVEPTCQYNGYIRYICTMCGDYYDETLYTLAHEYTESERVEPTCQVEGYVRYTCSMCGDYYDETLYTLAHEYTESERVEPTCQVEGYVRYTCSMCGEYYDDVLSTIRHKVGEDNYCTMCGEYIDQRPADILVVQNDEPWGRGGNRELMQNMLSAGSINSYKIVSSSNFHYEDLNAYSVIYVVMNADVLTVSQVNSMYDKILDFINAGGTVIYGLCWYNNYAVTLPGGAVATYDNGNYGTIVDYDHPIMSGELSDFVRFPDDAYGSSLNHSYISTVPENANVILKDDKNHAILVEYNYGGGSVILSCLTWEFYYNSNNSYSSIAYDDLILYAASLSGSGIGGGDHCKHSFIEVEVVEPTCTTDGYTRFACELCGYAYTGNYVSQYGHTVGEWIIDYEPTCTTSGRKHSECAVCGQQLENIYISSLGHNYVTEVTREVTCTTPGILTHTCERCGSSYSTYVYSEHAYSITEQVQPTCYTDGYTVYTCSKCGDYYTEIIPGGHDYKSTITKVATSEEDGEITYTCEACGDFYTEVIPAREAANVLLVQDRYPWGENNNAALLNQMLKDGYITGWDMTTTSNFANVDLGAYNVILIANDQGSATYNQLNYLGDTLVQFATAGGVVIYGACDSGWAGGNINYTLPEGVVKKNFYSRYNYIVDGDHLIVSGILTDGKALTNSLLNGNYCSHSAFDANTLPAGANVILQDAHGDATLVEYAVGDGHIILSGLTWEFYYNRNCYDGRTNTSYTKNVYDDLVMYALYLSDPCEHIYDEGVVVAPTCTEDGYTKHTCQNCGATMKDNVVEALGHTEGEWTVTTEPTQYAEGLKELHCAVCGEVLKSEVLPPLGGAAARVESDFDYVVIGDTIVFTLVIENCDPIKSLSVVPMFDSSVFDIVSAEWLLQDAMIQDIEEGTYKSVSVWGDYVDVNCAVYRIALKAQQFTDDTSVTFSLMVEDKEGVVTVVAKSVSVTECPHANTVVENINDAYHARVCELCGYAVMEEHIYDDDYDLECNECGNTRECRHPETYVSILDGFYHVYACALCGHTEQAEHVFDGEEDLVCDECGYQRECHHPKTYVTILDGIYHAHVCVVCDYQETEQHTYDSDYDLVCDTCGYERECPHSQTYVEMVDSGCHVRVCSYCGYSEMEAHILDNGECIDCGYMALVKGDVDNDGDVDSDDAVYLVYNVFFGFEDYPVKQKLDFDGDGQETTDDAIYLLYFIYFGEASYPLH